MKQFILVISTLALVACGGPTTPAAPASTSPDEVIPVVAVEGTTETTDTTNPVTQITDLCEEIVIEENEDGELVGECDGIIIKGIENLRGPRGERGDSGADGSDGQSCEITETTEHVYLTCGDSTIQFDLDVEVIEEDVDEDDGETTVGSLVNYTGGSFVGGIGSAATEVEAGTYRIVVEATSLNHFEVWADSLDEEVSSTTTEVTVTLEDEDLLILVFGSGSFTISVYEVIVVPPVDNDDEEVVPFTHLYAGNLDYTISFVGAAGDSDPQLLGNMTQWLHGGPTHTFSAANGLLLDFTYRISNDDFDTHKYLGDLINALWGYELEGRQAIVAAAQCNDSWNFATQDFTADLDGDFFDNVVGRVRAYDDDQDGTVDRCRVVNYDGDVVSSD
jgi:hypothetical protein